MKGTPTAYRPKKRKAARVVPSAEILRINGDIALKHLELHEVARQAGVNYTVVSGILNGTLVRPQHVPAIRRAVASFRTPAAR